MIWDFICLTRFFTPCPNQIIRSLIVQKWEPVQIILAKESFAFNILDNVKLEHFLADHKHFPLLATDAFRQPLQNFLASATHSMFAKPAIFIVLHLDVFVHDVGPLLQILQLVLLNHVQLGSSNSIVVLGYFMFLVWLVDTAIVWLTFLLCVDQVDNFKHLMLDVVLVYEGEYLVFDGGEICYLW